MGITGAGAERIGEVSVKWREGDRKSFFFHLLLTERSLGSAQHVVRFIVDLSCDMCRFIRLCKTVQISQYFTPSTIFRFFGSSCLFLIILSLFLKVGSDVQPRGSIKNDASGYIFSPNTPTTDH